MTKLILMSLLTLTFISSEAFAQVGSVKQSESGFCLANRIPPH
jgi:hypothetical protein